MVGRTPEFLGKKIQSKEVKLAALGVLVMPMVVLILTAHRASRSHAGRVGLLNLGPHGFTGDPLRLHLDDEQQRIGVRGTHRQHAFYNVTGGSRCCSGGSPS